MSPTSGNALPVGSGLRTGEYVIESCLGQGGFGITYRAEEKALRRTVAIKEFFPSACMRAATRLAPAGGWTQVSLDAFKSKFLEEGQMLARLRNAGIPHVYGVFEENGTAYLVMEYVEGRTLDAYLTSKGGKLPVNEATSIIRKAGEALQVVHAASLIHRDIKPSNIIVRSDGQVVLIDFGAAREFVPDAVYSQSQTVILTPGYAPLEQYSRQGKRGPFTDVYALAATLYFLLTGRRPVDATDRATGEPLQSPRDIRPEVPKQVSDAVMTGLRIRSDERQQSAVEFCRQVSVEPGASEKRPKRSAPAPTTPNESAAVPREPVPAEPPKRSKPAPIASNFVVPASDRIKFVLLYTAVTSLAAFGLFIYDLLLGGGSDLSTLKLLLYAVTAGPSLGAVQWFLLSKWMPLSKLWIATPIVSHVLADVFGRMQHVQQWSDGIALAVIVAFGVGLAQWFVLRSICRGAWVWTLATMIGYSLMAPLFTTVYGTYSPSGRGVWGSQDLPRMLEFLPSVAFLCQAVSVCFMRVPLKRAAAPPQTLTL